MTKDYEITVQFYLDNVFLEPAEREYLTRFSLERVAKVIEKRNPISFLRNLPSWLYKDTPRMRVIGTLHDKAWGKNGLKYVSLKRADELLLERWGRLSYNQGWRYVAKILFYLLRKIR